MVEKKFRLIRKEGGDAAKAPTTPNVRFVMKPRNEEREFPFSDQDFKVLGDLIHSRTGIVIRDHKKNMVYGRLSRRLRSLGLKSFSDYLHFLAGKKGEAEIGLLINAITTNLTRFFREDHHFDYLEKTIMPDCLKRVEEGKQNRIRLWSAGCSSGEEPYSIAMVADRVLSEKHQQDVDLKILATDLDTSMLEKGRNGDYLQESFEQFPVSYQNYLLPSSGQENAYHISNDLRNMIAFKPLNLISDWPHKGPFDAIFCRNVMIYFDAPTKSRLIGRLVDLLRPGGWLLVGHSETILDTETRLSPCGRTIYQKIQ